MIRVYTDFNSRTPEDLHPVLYYKNRELSEQIEELGLKQGDQITLYQDEEDFEVTATLEFVNSAYLLGEKWVARPDWKTIIRHNK